MCFSRKFGVGFVKIIFFLRKFFCLAYLPHYDFYYCYYYYYYYYYYSYPYSCYYY